MKKLLLTLMMIVLCTTAASATILPATGVDEDYRAWTGIDATRAVVLCESLSVLDARGDQGGRKVMTLNYTGKDILVIDSWDGWAQIHYSDGAELGWVRSDYLLMDPAWYLCDEDVQVYAYPDTMAPRVALLDEGAKLPIITGYDAEYESWVCVSLRGAAGWIRKTPRDTVDNTWFRPEMLADITAAVLQMGDEAVGTTEQTVLTQLAVLLTNVEDEGGPMAGIMPTPAICLIQMRARRRMWCCLAFSGWMPAVLGLSEAAQLSFSVFTMTLRRRSGCVTIYTTDKAAFPSTKEESQWRGIMIVLRRFTHRV